MLNKYQKKVVYCENNKPLLVEAGPGSGKTHVLVERIKFLLENGAEPETFLAITFSRKAAEQLKNNLYNELPREVVDKMQISTIHSFCHDFLNENGVNVVFIDDDNSERKELFLKRHREQLGFIDEFTIRNYSSVISKFSEYTSYDVDTEKLVDYISENRPFSDEYVKFVNSLEWFQKKVIKNAGYNDDWYNAKYLKVAQAYPTYLELLDKYAYVDYDTVQKKTMELFESKHINNYKHVLIDEFQDTDPIQARIFRKLVDESETFMAVGDIDQRIYFFRGAYGDYFEEFSKEYDVEVFPLNINYRSSNEIIKVSEEFIKEKRGGYSSKKLEPYRNISNDSYFLNNETPKDEAENILNYVKYLKEENIIQSYSEIAILTRSITFSDTIPILMEYFINENIPVNVVDFNDLGDKNEIKSIITLLFYLIRRSGDTYSHKVEREWGGFKAFNGEEFTPIFWDLSDSTKEYLNELEENFAEDIGDCEKELLKKFGIRGRKSKSLDHLLNNKKRDENFVEALFNCVERPSIDLDRLDDSDREFFSKLNRIRDSIYVKENGPTILDVYYQLLEIGGYFKENIINNDDYSSNFENLAILTKTIENYENYYSKHDIKGLLIFLTRMIENYGSNDVVDDGIQIMTVHKAKGLEFPVTILLSLEKDSFPAIPKDPNRENDWNMFDETFYTPNYCLNYKTTTEDEDNELEVLEGIRLVYVGMTRAQDILVLSNVGEVPDEIDKILPLLKEMDFDNLNNKKLEHKHEELDGEKLSLSYSSFDTYLNCPLKYKLVYNFDFKTSSSNFADIGSLTHRVLDAINHKLKINNDIGDEEVIEISRKVYSSKFDIQEDDEDFQEFCDNILDYLDEFLENDLEVIDSEVPFSIEFDDFVLEGAIDLIYKDGNTIKILDYKNTEYKQSNIDRYKTQLLTYILALKKDPYYKQYLDTKQAAIYFLQSNKLLKLDIDEDNDFLKLLDRIKCVANNINNNCFDSNKSDYCNICEFKSYCECGKNG